MESEQSEENVNLRSMLCELSMLSRPDGSATICLGETVVTAAVYGPVEVRVQKELATEANVEVVYKPRTGLPGCHDRFHEHLVKNSVKTVMLSTQYPRTRIVVVLQEVQNSGSLLSSCVNAACLALIDSSVAMKCLIAAVSCVVVAETGEIILDPNSAQEKTSRAKMFFAFDSRDHSLVSSHSDGSFSKDEFRDCLHLCRTGSKKIFDFYRDAVARKFSKT